MSMSSPKHTVGSSGAGAGAGAVSSPGGGGPSPTNLSSQERRMMMKKLEHMVAEAEARVRTKQDARAKGGGEDEETGTDMGTGAEAEAEAGVGAGKVTCEAEVKVVTEQEQERGEGQGQVYGQGQSASVSPSANEEEEEEYLRVTTRLNKSTEEVHVSDVSSDDEGYVQVQLHAQQDENESSERERGLNVSHIYSSGSEEDESLQSLFGSPEDANVNVNVVVSPNSNNRQQSNHNGNGSGISGDHDDNDKDRNEHQMKGSGSNVPTADTRIPQRSLMEEMNLEQKWDKKGKGKILLPTSASTSIPLPRCYNDNDDDDEYDEDGFEYNPGASSTYCAPPQDRSVTSRKSAYTYSHSVAESFVTPNNQPYVGDPIVSPPFTLMSPARSRASRTTISGGTGTGTGAESSIHAKSTVKKAPKSSSSTAGWRSSQKSVSSSIESPPRGERIHRGGPSATATATKTLSASRSAKRSAMKKEIDKLTMEFAQLERESERRRARFDLDPEKRFDASVNLMEKKADAMVDSIHRNYARSFASRGRGRGRGHSNDGILYQEPQVDPSNLGMGKSPRVNLDMGMNMGMEMDMDMGMNMHTQTPRNSTSQQHAIREESHKTPQQLLDELDPSDDYVKRQYPAVPKTPGTMFTTEMVEVMGLDVGEHAYLAEVMDRQWGTKADYRPR